MQAAVRRYKPGAGLIHHSDQGVQYASRNNQVLLLQTHIIPSMSRKGTPYGNACAEAFFSAIKLEMVYHEHYATRVLGTGRYFRIYQNLLQPTATKHNHRQHCTGRIPTTILSAADGMTRNLAIFFDFSRLHYFFVSEISGMAQVSPALKASSYLGGAARFFPFCSMMSPLSLSIIPNDFLSIKSGMEAPLLTTEWGFTFSPVVLSVCALTIVRLFENPRPAAPLFCAWLKTVWESMPLR
ncbi:MAG: hypothetical protein ABF463_08385 [Ethanoligenens sp.]